MTPKNRSLLIAAHCDPDYLVGNASRFAKACETGELSLVHAFIDAGIPVSRPLHNESALFDIYYSPPIVLAASRGHTEVVQSLVDAGADVNQTWRMHRRTALLWAVLFKSRELVNVLVGANADFEIKNDKGWVPLTLAINMGLHGVVEDLLIAGADPNFDKGISRSPLSYSKDDQMLELLLSFQADPNSISNFSSMTPMLTAAVASKNLAWTRILKAAGAVDVANRVGITAAMIAHDPARKSDQIAALFEQPELIYDTRIVVASSAGDQAEVDRLLNVDGEHERMLNTQDQWGTTPLVAAFLKKHWTLGRHLISLGADLTAVNTSSVSPVVMAAICDEIALAGELLKAGATPNDNGNSRALSEAVKRGCKEMVDLLLSNAANPDSVDSIGVPALVHASKIGRLDLIEALNEAGADLNVIDKEGRTPIFAAVNAGYADAVLKLLELGASCESGDSESPLARAVAKRMESTVEILLDFGADYTATFEGRGPLDAIDFFFYAHAWNVFLQRVRTDIEGNPKSVSIEQILIVARVGTIADVKNVIKCGVSVSQFAGRAFNEACRYNLDVANFLMDHGVELKNAPDKSPLAQAALGGNCDLMTRMLDRGVDVNEVIMGSSTFCALSKAIAGKQWSSVKILLDSGAILKPFIGKTNPAGEKKSQRIGNLRKKSDTAGKEAKPMAITKNKMTPYEKYQPENIPGSPEEKCVWLIEALSTSKRPERYYARDATIALFDEFPKLAAENFQVVLGLCDTRATAEAVFAAAIKGSKTPNSTVAEAVAIAVTAKSKQAKILWWVRMAALEWYISNEQEPADRALFSPFTKGVTTKLAKLGGTLPLCRPTALNETEFSPLDDSQKVSRKLSYVERYLTVAIRGRFRIKRKNDENVQDINVGTDCFVVNDGAYIQWGWLETSQFHVLIQHTADGLNQNPLIYESDHGPFSPNYTAKLSDYLKFIRKA